MSMGHKEPGKTGDERDAFDSKTKRNMGKTPGKRSAIKRGFNRRVRREVKIELRKMDVDGLVETEPEEEQERGWWTG